MAIHLNLSNVSSKPEDKIDAKIHLMPCSIKTNDEANVSKFFEPNINVVRDDILSASFRGYPLLGKEISVPKNYCGVVLRETREKMSEEATRNLYATETFNKLTYWNWDKTPTDNDKFISALDWLDISHAIHEPVEGLDLN